MVCLINDQRRAHGLPALTENARLNRSAQGWTNVMVIKRYFSHGTDFAIRITDVGFRWSSVGENIATGYRTAAAVVTAWMASPGHCENILSPMYRYVGTGVSNRPIAGFSNEAGTWTQDFGLLMGQPAPTNWARRTAARTLTGRQDPPNRRGAFRAGSDPRGGASKPSHPRGRCLSWQPSARRCLSWQRLRAALLHPRAPCPGDTTRRPVPPGSQSPPR